MKEVVQSHVQLQPLPYKSATRSPFTYYLKPTVSRFIRSFSLAQAMCSITKVMFCLICKKPVTQFHSFHQMLPRGQPRTTHYMSHPAVLN